MRRVVCAVADGPNWDVDTALRQCRECKLELSELCREYGVQGVEYQYNGVVDADYYVQLLENRLLVRARQHRLLRLDVCHGIPSSQGQILNPPFELPYLSTFRFFRPIYSDSSVYTNPFETR